MAPSVGMQRILNVLASLGAAGAIAFPKHVQARDMLTWESSLDHPGFGATPQSMLAAFREAEAGYPRRQCNLFDDFIEGDAHTRSLFEKREEAVAGKPSTIQAGAAGELDEQIARMLRFALGRLPMLATYKHLLKFNRYGWACARIQWGFLEFEGRLWAAPVGFVNYASRRFRVVSPEMQRMLLARGEDVELDDLRLYTDPGRPWGDALDPREWLILRRDTVDLSRAALMRTGAWNCLGKKLSFADWIVLSQRYGLPVPIATYKTIDEHADDKAIDVAYEIVAKIGTDGGAAVPDTVKLELVKAFEGDGAKMQGGLIAYCNRENSKLVNGSTLANDNGDSGGASYALGDIHDDVRWEAVVLDALCLQLGIGGQVFEPTMYFNGLVGLAATPTLFIQVVRDLTPKSLVDIANVLKNELGIDVSIEQLRAITGMREPTSTGDAAPGAPAPVTPIGAAA